MIKRDYIERLIAQAARALEQVMELVRAGELDPALQLIRRTGDLVLGPLAKLLDRLDAASAVQLAGRYELDRIRLYAALVGEEGGIHELRGRPEAAERCYRRSLELYAAASEAGVVLLPADRERILRLAERGTAVEERYRPELERLGADAGS